MSIESTLSALRTLRYSSAKLADLITVGITDTAAWSQVREACLRELRWVDDLVGGEAATGLTLTDAERKALRCAAATCRGVGRPSRAWPENQWADTIDALLERHAKGGET